jgi:uncharacterized protein (DUF2062 family)
MRIFYFVSKNIKFWRAAVLQTAVLQTAVLQTAHRHSLIATVAIGKTISMFPE